MIQLKGVAKLFIGLVLVLACLYLMMDSAKDDVLVLDEV